MLTLTLFTTTAVAFLGFKISMKVEKNKEINIISKPVIDYFSKKSIEHKEGVLHVPINIPYRDIIILKKTLNKSKKIKFEEALIRYIDIVILLSSTDDTKSHAQMELFSAASELSDSIVEIIKKDK